MTKEELIIYAIRTSEAIKEEAKQELIDYVSNLQQENQQLKIQVSAREEEYRELEYRMNEISNFIEENKNKTIAPYGDNEDYDYEVCLDYDDITTLERIINNEYDYENR